VIVGQRDGLPECVGLVFNVGHGKREANEFGPVARANAALILTAVTNAEGIHEHGVLPNDLDGIIRQMRAILERLEPTRSKKL